MKNWNNRNQLRWEIKDIKSKRKLLMKLYNNKKIKHKKEKIDIIIQCFLIQKQVLQM